MAVATAFKADGTWSAPGRVDDSVLLYALCESPFLFSCGVVVFVFLLGPEEFSVSSAKDFVRVVSMMLFAMAPGIVLLVMFRSGKIEKQVNVGESGVTQKLIWRNRVVPKSTIHVPIAQLFGIRLTSDAVQIIRRPGYDAPLTLSDEYFPDVDSRNEFIEAIRVLGCKVIDAGDRT